MISQINIFRLLVILFAVYLGWVWFFYPSEVSIPVYVKHAWLNQSFDNILYPKWVFDVIHDVRKMILAPVAIIGLLLCNNVGKYAFLLFTLSGPFNGLSNGWFYSLYWVETIGWYAQLIQGGIVLMCFYGNVSNYFSWKVTYKK